MADPLSDLLDLVRIERAEFFVLEFATPGGCSVPLGGNLWCHLVLEGEVLLTHDGAAPLRLGRGDIVLLARGRSFTLRDGPESPTVELAELAPLPARADLPWLRFGGTGAKSLLVSGSFRVDRERAKPLLRRLPDLICLKSEGGRLPLWGGPLCDVTTLRLISSGAGAVAVMRRVAESCLIQVVRTHVATEDSPERMPYPLCRAPVGAACRLINSHPEKPWTISGLAREVGMSRSSFAAAFAHDVGQSPMRYLTGVRMALAAELLRSQTMPVAQVAFRVGFVSETSFARTFRRHFRLSPGAYRLPDTPAAPPQEYERGDYPGFIFVG